MSDHSSDPQLDAQLRDVPLGENFLDRLKAALVPSDEAIDRRLREVHVPGSISERLRAIPDDVALDERIAALPTPAGLVQRLYSIPREQILAHRKRSPVRRAVEAAGLALGLAGSLAAAVLLVLSGAFPMSSADLEIAAVNPPGELPTLTITAPREIDAMARVAQSVGPTSVLMVGAPSQAQPWTNFESPESSLIIDEVTGDLLADAGDLPQGPVGEWTSLSHNGLRMMDDVMLLKFGILGSPQYTNDVLPELETPWTPSPRGIEPPLVRGYDRVFFLKHRVHPPISPGANAALQTLAVPLTVDTGSFRRAWRQLRQQGGVGPGEVRVEDFIAAVDYRFPSAPAGELGLRTASGPSPFAAAGAGLLQVGVQAGPIERDARRTMHLVLAIDASASMGKAGRWTEVVDAVSRVLSQMTVDDHLSLVVFRDETAQRWEDIRPAEAATIVRELQRQRPSGGSNLLLGLQQAVSVAMSQELAQTQFRRLVLITDDPSAVPASQREVVREMFLAAREADVAFDVIDLGQLNRPAPFVTELTSQLDGDYRQITDGRAMSWMLLERLAGQSSVVASEAKLTIRFNPQAVAAYRLIGHEANALAGLSPPSLEAELHAADAATTLVELWLQPGDVDDVGVATLTWLDPQTGESHKRTQRISRLQFAPTFAESAPSLQAAAIAAETAEVLRGSREALRQANPALPKPSWDAILAAADEANPVLDGWADYRRLLELVRLAREGKP